MRMAFWAFALFAAIAPARAAPPHSVQPHSIQPDSIQPDSVKPAPTKADALRILVLAFESSEVEQGTLRTIGSLVTANLSEVRELDVVSGEDLRRMLALQGEKETLGCSDDQSCLADVADALGAKLVVFGNVGRLGDVLVVSLNLFDAEKMKGVGRTVVEVKDLGELPRLLRPKLREMITPFLEDKGIELQALTSETSETRAVGPWPWVLATTGGALFVLGGALAGTGLAPLIGFQASKTELGALEQLFRASGDTTLLPRATTVRGDVIAQQASWNRWGALSVDIGVPVLGVGAALFIGGIVWGMQEPEAGGAP